MGINNNKMSNGVKKYILIFSVVVLGFGFPAVVSAGDPVDGIDISLDEIPGGVVKNTQTDANGNYVFDKLAPGAYLLRIGSLGQQKGTDYNSSISNSSGSLSLPGGGTEQTINIEVSDKVLLGKDPGTAITVETPGPGRIKGNVTKEDVITTADLGVENPGILPTSGFYFLKEWRRGITRVFTFNSVAKAELELKITNEKAAELKEVSKSNTDARGLEKAVANYKDNAERLRARFEALKETSANPNVDKLLDKLADRVIKHEQLFEELKAKHEAAREKIKAAQEDFEETAADAAERLDTAEKLKERFEKAVENQRERSAKEIRAIGALDRIEERVKNDEVRVKISEVKDGLIKKFDARVSSRLIAPSAIPQLLENLPITEVQKLRILEQIKERTKSGEIKVHLENVEGKIRAEVKEEAGGKKEEAERIMKNAAELLNDLKERINSGKYANISESVKTLLLRAENHMVNAKTAFENGKFGEAFGQANSAASNAKNAISQLLRANIVKPTIEKPAGDEAYRKKIENLEKCGPRPGAPGGWICRDGGWQLVGEKPEICTMEYEPVCGVNGKTYGNACEAWVAGVAVKSKGECPTAGTPTNLLPKTIIPELKVEVPSVTAVPVARKWNVEIRGSHFSPSELKIKKGDTVVWTNFDSSSAWPASAIHPTHQVYPGFDALKGINTGVSYSFTFDKIGSWKYHNHLSPLVIGIVEVSE